MVAAELVSKSLGKIEGLCACYSKATLNGRPYDKIYKDILAGNNYRFNEMMRRGGILCEFGHPSQYTADFERTETDPEKAVAIVTGITEGEEGKIFAEGYILDTPAGKTYKAIAPFYKFGFSSRGSYEADETSTEGPNGWNQETYLFKGFDIVILPANEGSEISASESTIGKKGRKTKSARESLDLNNITDAVSVDKEEIEHELDKLFDENGNLAPVEYIDARDFEKDSSSGTQENSAKDPILLDLQKVLTQKDDLQRQLERLLFEKAASDAALISLQNQLSQISKIKEEAEQKLSDQERTNQEIRELAEKLLSVHNSYTDSANGHLQEISKQSEEVTKQRDSLAAQVTSLSKEGSILRESNKTLKENLTSSQEQLKAAKEQIETHRITTSNLKSITEQLRTEIAVLRKDVKEKERLAAEALDKAESYKKSLSKAAASVISARESLIDTYSDIYSISKEALKNKVNPKTDTAETIRSAAEQLSNDTFRLAAYSGGQLQQKVELVRPKVSFRDDSEAELFEALQIEGYLGRTQK